MINYDVLYNEFLKLHENAFEKSLEALNKKDLASINYYKGVLNTVDNCCSIVIKFYAKLKKEEKKENGK